MKQFFSTYRMSVLLILLGLVLIVHFSLAFNYFQQPTIRQDINRQISVLAQKLELPLDDISLLRKQVAEIDVALAPISNSEAIVFLLDLARESGIDVSEELGNFVVPIPENSASGGYEVISFNGIHVQGDKADVLEYIRVLDSNDKLKSSLSVVPRAVIRNVGSVSLLEVDAYPVGEEAERRTECREISGAVAEMMEDNLLRWIPNPFGADAVKATNRMGDDPATISVFDGFPDNSTTAAQKGYTGNGTPKAGYLLFRHDKINSDNSSLFSTVNYYSALTTKYYYTVDVDGKVRQWKSSNAMPYEEYTDCGQSKRELRASIYLKMYFKKN